ncbi:MAG TPA: hypothetical protein VFF67_05040 [Thermoplasmata archaeon]|nr:hypothetical protein [Thermoplasmata archaeon]
MPTLRVGRTPTGGRPQFAPELVVEGRAWLRGRLHPIEIGIGDDGRIVRVARAISGPRRRHLGDAILLPSATDLHVHFRDPGPPGAIESFETGTIQAALGGVGAVGDMPNTRPLVDRVSRWEDKAARARHRIAVDVVLYGAAQSPLRVAALARVCGALKTYLSPTSGIEVVPEIGSVGELLAGTGATDLPHSVHAEDPGRFPTRPLPRGTTDWDADRPIAAEVGAVEAVVRAAGSERLNLAHVTSEEALEIVARAGFAAEASPGHLLLSTSRARDAFGKVNPPLRAEAERAGLLRAFAAGRVQFLASDHAPHSLEEKERSFDQAPSGMPGVETMLPLLLAEVRAARVPLPALISAACDRPARWFGQPHGRIEVGHRANLFAVDFRERTTIRAERLHAPCGWSAFEGWEAVFPREHLLGGERVVQDGEYVGRPNGRVVRPEFADRLRSTA